MDRRRRQWPRLVAALLVAGGSAALGLTSILAGPASAAAPPLCGLVKCQLPKGTVALSSPSPGPPTIRTIWTGVPTDAHIDQLTVTVTWITPGTPVNAPVPDQTTFTIPPGSCATTPDAGGTQECDVAWPAQPTSNGYVLNGQYSVTASAVSCPTVGLLCSDQASTATTSLDAKNPPAPPANVAAKLATAPAAGVVVTWDPNPEPDVFGYEVIRVAGSKQTVIYGCSLPFAPPEFASLARCDAKPSWTDTTSGGGKFSYQVIATRFGRSYATADQVHSTPAQSKGTITVAGPPAATATTKPIGLTGLGAIFNPVKPRGGNVVAPVFGNLGPRTTTPATVDPGFNPTLPYSAPAPTDPPAVVSAPPPPAAKGHSSVGSIALVGAGLLVIVVALHGLWLRGEVRRSGALEALEPEL